MPLPLAAILAGLAKGAGVAAKGAAMAKIGAGAGAAASGAGSGLLGMMGSVDPGMMKPMGGQGFLANILKRSSLGGLMGGGGQPAGGQMGYGGGFMPIMGSQRSLGGLTDFY